MPTSLKGHILKLYLKSWQQLLLWYQKFKVLLTNLSFARLTAYLRFPSDFGSKGLSWSEVFARCPVHNKVWYWRTTQWAIVLYLYSSIYGEWELCGFYFHSTLPLLPPKAQIVRVVYTVYSPLSPGPGPNSILQPLKFCGWRNFMKW